jgi:deoxyhypusine synthase
VNEKYKPADLSRVRTYPLSERQNKVTIDQCGEPHEKGSSVRDFLLRLPHVLGADALLKVAEHVVAARRAGRPVLLMMGGHVVKCGLGPVVVDLIERGVVTAVATNGAGSIHDFEMALIGATSEDVDAAIDDGRFGMAEETGRLMNEAIKKGADEGIGMGEALGQAIVEGEFPHGNASILAQAHRSGIPATVHVGIGTDIIHQHPAADGAALGATSQTDFRLLASVLGDLEGGVVMNVGSAVVLPEVFVKALSVARNLGNKVRKFVAVDMDMIAHYRPQVNVLDRPTQGGGEAYRIVGHHEIMLPLLAAAVIETMEKETFDR